MHKRKQWIVVPFVDSKGNFGKAGPGMSPSQAGTARPGRWCGWSPPGTVSRRKETCTDPAGRECNLLKIAHKIS